MVDVNPTLGDQAQPREYSPPSSALDWIGKQPYNADLAAFQTGNYAPGKISGGPTEAQLPAIMDPRKTNIFAKVPALTDPAQTNAASSQSKLGNFTLDAIDPFTTGESLAQGLGASPEQAVGFVDQVNHFMGQKDLNVFGGGSTGIPARLADYAMSPIQAAFGALPPAGTAPATSGDQLGKYRFQQNVGYWTMLADQRMDAKALASVAQNLANTYMPGGGSNNQQLAAQLLDQFKTDQGIVLGTTSGDQHTDYVAMMKFQTDYITQRFGTYVPETTRAVRPSRLGPAGAKATVTVGAHYTASLEGIQAGLTQFDSAVVVALPVVDGTGIAKAIYQPPKLIQDAWDALTPDQRKQYYQGAGTDLLMANFITWAPVMAALGPAEALLGNLGKLGAAGAKLAPVGKATVQAYHYARNIMAGVMATGLTVAAANWTAEAISPEYAAGLGAQIDNNRPISSSWAAGLVNQMGFFSSGSFGASLALRTAGRLAGRTVGVAEDVAAATGHPLPTIIGKQEIPLYADALGGSKIASEIAGTGIPGVLPNLEMAPKEYMVSALKNVLQLQRIGPFDEAIRNGTETGIPAFDALSPENKILAANEHLARTPGEVDSELVAAFAVLNKAREPRPLADSQAQAVWDSAKGMSDHYQKLIRDYAMTPHIGGEVWLARKVGNLTREQYARETVNRLGGDGTQLGKHDAAGWAQVIRHLDLLEYRGKNATLHSIVDGEPASTEAPKLQVMRSNHVFGNDMPGIRAKLGGEDAAAAAAEVGRLARATPEGGKIYSEWDAPAGVLKSPEAMPPAEMLAGLEEVSPALPSRRPLPDPNSPTAGGTLNTFHAQLEQEGNWTLAFKPTDAEGNFVSYVRRGNGAAFQSPWIEYPLGNAADIEIGNRGLLGRKLDAVFRGFDTIRVTEFQRGLLFRRMAPFDVTPEQVEAFNMGVYKLAREFQVQPQTVGAIARTGLPFTGSIAKEINELAKSVFGPGNVALKAGGSAAVNWADVIAKSYRQSLKLNLTAGLTSMMKAHLGTAGGLLAFASDPAYVAWRFGFSPLFHAGNWWEAAQINAMYGAHNLEGPAALLFAQLGVGHATASLALERAFDPMLTGLEQGFGKPGAPGLPVDPGAPEVRTSGFARAAAGAATAVPQDLGTAGEVAQTQGAGEAMIRTHMGGTLPDAGWLAEQPANGRVVTPGNIPATHTVELGDIRPDLLSADQLGADQGLWHATIAVDRVMEQGVKNRKDMTAHDVNAAHPAIGEGFNAWRDRLHATERGGTPIPANLKAPPGKGAGAPLYRQMSLTELEQARAAKEFRPMQGIESEIHLTANPDALHPGPGQAIVEFNPDWLSTINSKSGIVSKKEISWDRLSGNVNRVWEWDPKTGDATLAFERSSDYTGSHAGLGGAQSTGVSATPIEAQAFETARRMKMVGQAARDEATNAEIVDHFAEWYGNDYYSMAKILGVPSKDFEALARRGADGADVREQLIAWMDAREARRNTPAVVGSVAAYRPGELKFEHVAALDSGLASHGPQEPGEFNGHTGLVAGYEAARRIDPEQVGVVRLAVKRGAPAPDGADVGEVRMNADDLLVVDDRQRLAPLADTEDGLLAQFRATLADKPKDGQLTLADHMVGGNGFAPALETRARAILTKLEQLQQERLDGGPTFAYEHITPIEKVGLETALANDGWLPLPKAISDAYAAGDIERGQALNKLAGGTAESGGAVRTGNADLTNPIYARTLLDGTVEGKPIAQLYDEFQRKPGAAAALEHVAGTAEAFESMLSGEIAKVDHNLRRDILQPTGYKMWKANALAVHWFREQFPNLVDLSGNVGLRQMFNELKIPEARWADWYLKDRLLSAEFTARGDQGSFERLLGNVGGDAGERAEWDTFYKSEDWTVLRTLVRANFEVQESKAFAVHFFETHRSWLERSINHPVLAIYPASWTIKIAKVWLKFLYDNETLGLKIGMTPAQAIAQIVHAQKQQLALGGGNSKTDLLSQNGPLGSAIFIANLILPGDWSGLPFSTSRTIRDYLRPLAQNGTLPASGDVLANDLKYIGASRDVRLMFETLGEVGDFLRGPQAKQPPSRSLPLYSLHGGIPTYSIGADTPLQ